MNIRQANDKDVEGILKLQLEVAEFHKNLDSIYEFQDDIAEQFRINTATLINNEKACVFIALDKEEIVGFGIAAIIKENPLFKYPRYAMIEELGITENFRSKGCGQILLDAIFKWLRQQAVEDVRLKVHSKNKGGIKFWEKMGFETEMYNMKIVLNNKNNS